MSEITIKVKPNGDVSVKTEHDPWTSRASADAVEIMREAFRAAETPFPVISSLGEPLTAALLAFLQGTEDREDRVDEALALAFSRPGVSPSADHVRKLERAHADCLAMKALVADTFNRLHELQEAAFAGKAYDPAVIHLKKSST